MKLVLLSIAIFFAKNLAAQTLSGESLITSSGFVIKPEDEILFGTGTMPNGDFKYIADSRTNVFTKPQKGVPPQVKKFCAGHTYKVKKIRVDGNEKNGYTYAVILFGDGVKKYEMDADGAISSGEIVVPEKYRPKSVTAMSTLSASEQLEKLGKLYRDSLLTKEEFEAQKKKILSQ